MAVVLADIEIGRPLGAGAFGAVYEASVPIYGTVAVKVLDCARMEALLGLSKADWPVFSSQIYREAEALKEAMHDNVVEVHSVQYDAGRDHVLIVTELCECSLEKVIEKGALPLADVARFARHALAGMECMHIKGMLHRDIKPGNLLLRSRVAKLSDFGLVTANLVAGYGSQAGYISHLAPEVFGATGVTSTQSDVWAMGMTIYRLLNGEPWYKEVQKQLGIDGSRGNDATERMILRGGFARNLPFMPHVPDPWRRFVRKAMHDDRSVRFANATTMLSAVGSLGLPATPSYDCDMSDPSVVRWTRNDMGRIETVEWSRSPASETILAYTAPSPGVAGIKRSLIKQKAVAPKQAVKELQAFFQTRTR